MKLLLVILKKFSYTCSVIGVERQCNQPAANRGDNGGEFDEGDVVPGRSVSLQDLDGATIEVQVEDVAVALFLEARNFLNLSQEIVATRLVQLGERFVREVRLST